MCGTEYVVTADYNISLTSDNETWMVFFFFKLDLNFELRVASGQRLATQTRIDLAARVSLLQQATNDSIFCKLTN